MNLYRNLTLLLFGCGVTAIACAENSDPVDVLFAQYVSGSDYRLYNEREKSLYVVAVLDGITINSRINAQDKNFNYESPFVKQLQKVKLCTKSMAASQLVAIVDKDLKDNPEYWHLPMSNHVWNALLVACDAVGIK